jgi:hypothetical protein
MRVRSPLSWLLRLVLLATPQALTAQAADGGARYRLTSTSVISLDRAPQAALVDTIQSGALLTISISAASDTIATLAIDSLQTQSTGMVRRTADAFVRGISVSALLSNGRPLITGDSATACTSERPLAGLLPDLLPMLPQPLRPDQQWTDSVALTTCRAGLPVTTHAIYAYRTLSGMDSTTVLLERRGALRVAGSAVLRTQTVDLNGTGTSEALATVSTVSRRVQNWRGTQVIELLITNGQQTRRIEQRITDTVAALP